LKSISNEIKENWDNTYMDAKYNPDISRKYSGQEEDQKNNTRALPYVAAS
jgi:hypothetical protein